MRVISGSAKGIRLSSVPGKTTRPITDQVKEALFNILGTDVIDSYFFDLFGGTGSVGIEALSRGAEYAVFLDTNYRACKVIQQNLQATNLHDYATVLNKDAFAYLREKPDTKFNFIYIAPPQYKGYWLKAMQVLDQNPGWIDQGDVVIAQIHPKEYPDNKDYTNFAQYLRRDYGDTVLIFFERILAK